MNQKSLTDVSGIVGLIKTNGFSSKRIIDLKASKIVQILSITLFDKAELYHRLTKPNLQNLKCHYGKQLILIDF